MVLQETEVTATATEIRWATLYLSSGVDPERCQALTEKARQRKAASEDKNKRFGSTREPALGPDRVVSVQRHRGGER